MAGGHKRTFSAERLDSAMEDSGESLGSEGGLQDLTDSYLDAIGDLTEAMDVVAHLVAHVEAEDAASAMTPALRLRLCRWRNTLTHAKARAEEVESRWWARHDEGICCGKKKSTKGGLQRADCGPTAHNVVQREIAEARLLDEQMETDEALLRAAADQMDAV